MPSSRSNSQARCCCASSRRCSRLASFDDHALQVGQLLVELLAQPGQLIGVAQVVGLDDLVELRGEGVVARGVVRPAAPRGAAAGRRACRRHRPRRRPPRSPRLPRRRPRPASARAGRRASGLPARTATGLRRTGPAGGVLSPPSSPSSSCCSDSASTSASARSSAVSSWRAAGHRRPGRRRLLAISASASSAFSPSVSRHRSSTRCAIAGAGMRRSGVSRASRPQRRGQRQLVLPRHAVVALGLAFLGAAARAGWRRRRPCACAPTASTRTCSSASKISRASRRPGTRLRAAIRRGGAAQRDRHRPRRAACAISAGGRARVGSGRRAPRQPDRPGWKADLTSASAQCAQARRVARLNSAVRSAAGHGGRGDAPELPRSAWFSATRPPASAAACRPCRCQAGQIPRRSSAGSIRPPSRAPARRTC